ncbi:MAG: hypothetical protein M3167_05725 [Acidobacteriota bacterium]|nr:hypothetical protein [Acidobacteriota bacterium]
MKRAVLFGGVLGLLSFCATCSSSTGKAPPAQAAPVAPSPTPLPTGPPTPLPVATPSSPSIYDRTPGVLYEEKGTPPPTQAEPSPTRSPKMATPRPASRRPTRTPTPAPQ